MYMIGINGLLLLFKQCRQAKLSYTGKFMAEVCFKYNDSGAVIREKFNFGQLPIMLQVGVLSFLFFIFISSCICLRFVNRAMYSYSFKRFWESRIMNRAGFEPENKVLTCNVFARC